VPGLDPRGRRTGLFTQPLVRGGAADPASQWLQDFQPDPPRSHHPRGVGTIGPRLRLDFDALFTKDKPVIFAFHADPSLIHRLTYRRTNHVRGYKEEGTITTPFDMTVLNDLDRFHLVIDAIDRLPQSGGKWDLPEAAAQGQADRAQAIHRQIRRGPTGDSELEVGQHKEIRNEEPAHEAGNREEARDRFRVIFLSSLNFSPILPGISACTEPMRISPAAHFSMGGLWVDYELMTNVSGRISTNCSSGPSSFSL
jgi:hypothetical protein